MSIDRVSDAYNRGSENYYSDFELKGNPYKDGTREYIDWEEGYLDALNAQDTP